MNLLARDQNTFPKKLHYHLLFNYCLYCCCGLLFNYCLCCCCGLLFNYCLYCCCGLLFNTVCTAWSSGGKEQL